MATKKDQPSQPAHGARPVAGKKQTSFPDGGSNVSKKGAKSSYSVGGNGKDSANNEETLRKGKLPKGGQFKNGNQQAKHTPSNGMSDHESLRNNNRPKPESVPVEAPASSVQKRAFNLNLRSQMGKANPTAHPAA